MSVIKPFLSIIIPAHNEAHRLPESLDKIQKFIEAERLDCEVLLVENASTDDTLKIAQDCQKSFPQLEVLSLDQPGKGNAIRTGMLRARGEFRFMADVDLSMPIEELRNSSSACRPTGSDRLREQPGSQRMVSLYRHLIGGVFNLWVHPGHGYSGYAMRIQVL